MLFQRLIFKINAKGGFKIKIKLHEYMYDFRALTMVPKLCSLKTNLNLTNNLKSMGPSILFMGQ